MATQRPVPRSLALVIVSVLALAAAAGSVVVDFGRDRATHAALEAARERPDHLSVSIALMPPGGSAWDPTLELRSLLLHGEAVLVEPHGYWSETGQPVSAAAPLSEAQALAMAEGLASAGFFERARLDFPHEAGPHGVVRVQVWPADAPSPQVYSRVYPWNTGLVAQLATLRPYLQGPALAALDHLLAQLGDLFAEDESSPIRMPSARVAEAAAPEIDSAIDQPASP